MIILNREELSSLINHDAAACVSLYMPTHKAGRARQQDPIRLKNLLSEARDQLTAQGLGRHEIDAVLSSAESLRADDLFWSRRQDGLAIFCAPGFFRKYQVPLAVDVDLHVNRRFHVRPLIQLLHGNSRFFVLALSQGHAELYEATRYSIRNLNLPAATEGVAPHPSGRAKEPTLQFRTLGSNAGGRDPALFHGHGGAADMGKREIVKHFQVVDRAVSELLRGEDAPLVLACVGYLAAIYESVNSYARLIKGKVPGNPEMWQEDELRDRAWELVSPILNQHRERAISRLNDACGTQDVVTDLRNVVLAANDGRIDTLFLERGRQVPGFVDRELRAVHVHGNQKRHANQPTDELLDYAAAHTLINGGEVYLLAPDQLPTKQSAAALLRYAA